MFTVRLALCTVLLTGGIAACANEPQQEQLRAFLSVPIEKRSESDILVEVRGDEGRSEVPGFPDFYFKLFFRIQKEAMPPAPPALFDEAYDYARRSNQAVLRRLAEENRGQEAKVDPQCGRPAAAEEFLAPYYPQPAGDVLKSLTGWYNALISGKGVDALERYRSKVGYPIVFSPRIPKSKLQERYPDRLDWRDELIDDVVLLLVKSLGASETEGLLNDTVHQFNPEGELLRSWPSVGANFGVRPVQVRSDRLVMVPRMETACLAEPAQLFASTPHALLVGADGGLRAILIPRNPAEPKRIPCPERLEESLGMSGYRACYEYLDAESDKPVLITHEGPMT